MPGSFDAQDYADIHDDPFEVLAQVQEAWRKRDPPTPWSASNLPELDVASSKWYAHEIPAALTRTPGVTDDLLLGIVQSSIDNIKALASEENERRAQEEEEEQLEKENGEAKVKRLLGTDDEPYLPIIIVDESAAKQPEVEVGELLGPIEPDWDPRESYASTNISTASNSVTDEISARRADAVRAVRQGLDKAKALGLRKRLFNRGGDKTDKTSKDGNTPESSSFDLWRRRLAEAHDHAKQQAKQQAKSASQVLIKTEATESNEDPV